MKRITITLCLAVFLFSCSNKKKDESKTASSTETTTKPGGGVTLDSATIAKNWQDYMTPSDVHKMMAKWDGTWDSEVTMWMPGAPEQKSKGTCTNKMIFNGLYQVSDHSGNMMGMPFEGHSVVAYDNHRKEIISTWIDNMGSGIMMLRGTWDSTTNMCTLKGTVVDPGTKEDMEVRETFKIIDDNTQEMEMFGPDGKGGEMKTMHITFTRKQ